LRSGAFAPDCPVVIFVRLRLPSDSLGRIDGARLPGDHDAVLRGSLVCALLDLWTGQEICGAAELLPPGRRQSASVQWVVVRMCASRWRRSVC